MAERPRDALGRPLPRDADPALVAPPVADVSGLPDDEAWAIAIGYLDGGLPFHAHEVFEQRWRSCPPADSDAWRALAQWGAALTHAARGNGEGARRLATRAVDTLASARHVPSGIDVAAVRASCARLADDGGPVRG